MLVLVLGVPLSGVNVYHQGLACVVALPVFATNCTALCPLRLTCLATWRIGFAKRKAANASSNKVRPPTLLPEPVSAEASRKSILIWSPVSSVCLMPVRIRSVMLMVIPKKVARKRVEVFSPHPTATIRLMCLSNDSERQRSGHAQM